jgi:hypothetical protein
MKIQACLWILKISTAYQNQCCGSGSISGFNGVPGFVSGSGFASRIRIQEGKNSPEKQQINFIFSSAGNSLLRAEGFPCSLDVLYGGLESNCNFWSKKRRNNFSRIFFLQFLVIKTLDPYPDPDSMNPQHCNNLRLIDFRD